VSLDADLTAAGRLSAGMIPRRRGDQPVTSLALARDPASRPPAVLSGAGFVLPLPNRAPSRVRGLNPRHGPQPR